MSKDKIKIYSLSKIQESTDALSKGLIGFEMNLNQSSDTSWQKGKVGCANRNFMYVIWKYRCLQYSFWNWLYYILKNNTWICFYNYIYFLYYTFNEILEKTFHLEN